MSEKEGNITHTWKQFLFNINGANISYDDQMSS